MANRKLKAHPLSDVASLTGKSGQYYFWLNWETLAIFKVESGLTCIGFPLKLGTPGYPDGSRIAYYLYWELNSFDKPEIAATAIISTADIDRVPTMGVA